MSATLLARVRRVVIGHDGRALVHAVEDSGREHKLEVPAELVRETTASSGRHVLLLAWSLHELPDLGAATTAPARPVITRVPSMPIVSALPLRRSPVGPGRGVGSAPPVGRRSRPVRRR